MLSESNYIHSHKGDVKKICKSDDKLIHKVLDDYVVFVRLVSQMLLVFGELLDQRTVDNLITDISDQNVHDVRYLSVKSVGIENAALVCPFRDVLEVE